MISIYKWVAKHRTFVLYPIAIFECAMATAAIIGLGLSRTPALIACALILALNHFTVTFSFSRVTKEILSQRMGGDSKYAIALCDEMLSAKLPPQISGIFTINKCIFLRDAGEVQTVLDLLLDLDLSAQPPVHRLICYNNISDVYSFMGNIEKAEEYHLLAKETYEQLPAGKLKDSYAFLIPLGEADIHIMKGEYHDALECVKSIPEDKRDNGYHLTVAHALIGLGNTDEAKVHYNKVVESGLRNTETERLSRML